MPLLNFPKDLPVLGMSFRLKLLIGYFMPSTFCLEELGSLLAHVVFRFLACQARLGTVQVILQMLNRRLGLTTDNADEGLGFADKVKFPFLELRPRPPTFFVGHLVMVHQHCGLQLLPLLVGLAPHSFYERFHLVRCDDKTRLWALG